MHGRRNYVVEVIDRLDPLECRAVEEVGISRELGECLATQASKEVSIVDAREAFREVPRSSLEIEWDRDRSGATNRWNGLGSLAQILQQHVPPERNAGEHERCVWMSFSYPVER